MEGEGEEGEGEKELGRVQDRDSLKDFTASQVKAEGLTSLLF